MAGNGATEARNQRHLPSQQQFFLEQSEERFGGGAFSCSSGAGAVAISVNVCAGTGVMAELAVSILRQQFFDRETRVLQSYPVPVKRFTGSTCRSLP